jgi:predicted nucleotide-binding protein
VSDRDDDHTTAMNAALEWLLGQPGSGVQHIPARVLRHALRSKGLDHGNRVIEACVPALLTKGDVQRDRYYLTLDGLLSATDPRPRKVLATALETIAERYHNGELDQRVLLWSDIRRRGRFQPEDFTLAWHTILTANVGQAGGRHAASLLDEMSSGYDYDFWLIEHELESIAYHATVDQWVALQAARMNRRRSKVQPGPPADPDPSTPSARLPSSGAARSEDCARETSRARIGPMGPTPGTRRIGGALAAFWKGGDGPPRSSITSALLVGGHDGADFAQGNKEQLVLNAFLKFDEAATRLIADALLDLLRTSGSLHADANKKLFSDLDRAVKAAGHRLTDDDEIAWASAANASGARPRNLPHLHSKAEHDVTSTEPDKRKVFVIHGRNHAVRDAVFHFLRALRLEPIDFDQLAADQGLAFVGDIVRVGMEQAHGIIALFTPDEFSSLLPSYRGRKDSAADTERWQPRANVIFEAGMAFASAPKRTILAIVGDAKVSSDMHGLHFLHLDNTLDSRKTLRQKLIGAGCDVDQRTDQWTSTASAGDFSSDLPAGLAVRSPFGDP